MSADPTVRIDSFAGETRRERNKRDKLNRIVGSARALFQSQGYQKTTTQQIASAAGVATGTLFLYARSKEDLLVLVFISEMGEVVESSNDALDPEDACLDQVLDFFGGIIEYHARDTEIAHALIRELAFLSNPDRTGDVNRIVSNIVKCVGMILNRGVEKQEIEISSPRLVANMMFSIYYQQLQAWLSGFITRKDLETNLTAMMRHLLGHSR